MSRDPFGCSQKQRVTEYELSRRGESLAFPSLQMQKVDEREACSDQQARDLAEQWLPLVDLLEIDFDVDSEQLCERLTASLEDRAFMPLSVQLEKVEGLAMRHQRLVQRRGRYVDAIEDVEALGIGERR